MTGACPNTCWQKASINLLATVLSLCATMLRINFLSAEDLVRQFKASTSGDDGFSFPDRLKQMVTSNSHPTVSYLKILNHTIEIFMLMVRHGCHYTKEETDSLMDLLDRAAVEISDFEESWLSLALAPAVQRDSIPPERSKGGTPAQWRRAWNGSRNSASRWKPDWINL